MRAIFLPDHLNHLLKNGADLVVSISGGKDGQAMLNRLVMAYHRQSWTGCIYALHCDLGRVEWQQSLPHCQRIAKIAGVNLVVVRRPQGDLLQQIEARMIKLQGTGKPFWPSSQNRYCTSDQKRDQANKQLRKHHNVVISAEGIRADESKAREKKVPLSIRKKITTSKLKQLSVTDAINQHTTGRLAITWYPIFYWSEDDVYKQCGHSIEERDYRRKLYQEGRTNEALADWFMHPAYVYGNNRVSCAFCVLACINDLRNGAQHHPWLLNYYINLEIVGGSTFKNGFSLQSLVVK